MKSIISFVLLAGLLLSMVSAQGATQSELGAEIARLTNRSTDGLVTETYADGSMSIDLQDRFQHVVLLQAGDDGLPIAACVNDIEQANVFFGRNLLTGQALSPEADQAHEELLAAARLHGMSPQEYQFYADLIEGSQETISKLNDPRLFSSQFRAIFDNDPNEGFFSTAEPSLPAPFNDTASTLGEQRRNLMFFAGVVWSGFLDTPVEIEVNTTFAPLTCIPGTGAVGGSAQASVQAVLVGSAVTFYTQALANKLVGVDLNTGTSEILMTLNSGLDTNCLGNGTSFYYGLDNAQPAGTFNLFAIMLHELGHGLGFITFTNPNTGAYLGGAQDIWARFLYDRDTDKTWDDMTNAERVTSAVNTNDLFWDGPNIRIASDFLGSNGRDSATGRVQMATGGELSHFSANASPNLLMEAVYTAGLPLTLDLTRQLMRDIGWYRDTDTNGVLDTITNVLPGGGHLEIGTARSVSWTNMGGFSRNVTIELSIDGGATFPHLLAEDVENTGSKTVVIPIVFTSQGRIRVREHDFVAPVGVSANDIAINSNTRPTFTPAAAITPQQGSAPGIEPVVLGIANDIESSADNLSVTQIGGTATGITVGSIGVAANGTVFAPLSVSCTAASGTLRFEVFDGELTGIGDLQVNVVSNAAPTLGTYPNKAVSEGQSTLISPNAAPEDNGSVDAISASILPNTFSGGLIATLASGAVAVNNAAPGGAYTISVTITDNCGTTTNREMMLDVLGETIFSDGYELPPDL